MKLSFRFLSVFLVVAIIFTFSSSAYAKPTEGKNSGNSGKEITGTVDVLAVDTGKKIGTQTLATTTVNEKVGKDTKSTVTITTTFDITNADYKQFYENNTETVVVLVKDNGEIYVDGVKIPVATESDSPVSTLGESGVIDKITWYTSTDYTTISMNSYEKLDGNDGGGRFPSGWLGKGMFRTASISLSDGKAASLKVTLAT